MDDMLSQLEWHIHTLIQKYARSQKLNQHLEQGKQLLSQEKEQLLVKQKHAILLIENMVEHLKSIEDLQ